MATSHADLWLAQHGAGEEALAAVLRKYFRAQDRRILAALRGYSHPTPSIVPQIFHAAAEQERLAAVVADPIVKIMATGAATQLALLRPKKSKSLDAEAYADFELPADVLDAIRSAFVDLSAAPYWQQIQQGTAETLTDLITQGMQAGDNLDQMAKRINEALGGASKTRAMAIARTETTGAYNAGHQAAYDALGALLAGKTWLAIRDKDTRETHERLNEKTVTVKGNFIVGGVAAPVSGLVGIAGKGTGELPMHDDCGFGGVGVLTIGNSTATIPA